MRFKNLTKGFTVMTYVYPIIGSSVRYARSDAQGAIHQGQGQVLAIFLNPDKREMVQIRDGENVWNVDLALINPTPELVGAYKAAVDEVQAITNEGNALVKTTIDEYNGKVEAVYARVLSSPVAIADIPSAQPTEDAGQTVN